MKNSTECRNKKVESVFNGKRLLKDAMDNAVMEKRRGEPTITLEAHITSKKKRINMKSTRTKKSCNIYAGEIDQIKWDSGRWIFLDIGFSGSKKTCGIAFDKKDPKLIYFGKVYGEIIGFVNESDKPVNLVIEAPLSVAFDGEGNPKGRCFEKENGDHRYWYVGAGCSTMVAAIYLVSRLAEAKIKAEIRLFEGFVSFKKKTNNSQGNSHTEDVKKLREAVKQKKKGCFKDMTKCAGYKNSFKVLGLDFGVPPVIAICSEERLLAKRRK